MYRFVFGFWLWIGVSTGYSQTGEELARLAETLEDSSVRYVAGYVSIPYPLGDVPAKTGVCTDVVIRAFRLIDIDLQQAVHEDMKANFSMYPKLWGLSTTDKNIDHRRVPNLMTYFDRQGWTIHTSDSLHHFQPGDVVAWDLGSGLTHIGIVTSKRGKNGRPLVIHNIGGGQTLEDILFDFEVIGHYRLSTD
jgi:uncharacterized protein YijF (DUF1287 family)